MKFFHEILNPWRVLGLLILSVIVCGVGFLIYMTTGQPKSLPEVTFGVTFSQPFAEEMGLNWREAYLAILDDLGVGKLRLAAYWPKIEPGRGEYSFEDLDWQISEAERRGAEVILAVGRKLPRWPECHVPEWASYLSESEQQERILLMLTEVVNRYKDNKTITAWQVENEPFLKGFGECPELDKQFLDKEISLVRELDFRNNRPIIVTASGELSSWIQPALRADILGTTLYRVVWVKGIGYFKYPVPSVFYYKRANLVKRLTGVEKMIVVELQAEPWSRKALYEISVSEQARSMDLNKFKDIISYTKKTGFDEAYLWGVEWWYQRKARGNNAMWSVAKKLWE